MSWSAAGLVVVDKTADELRGMLADRFAEMGPISGYEPELGRASFAVGEAERGAALWDPIGKLAFGPRGEDLRRALSADTKVVAFRMSSADGKYGLRLYENGKPVRAIEVEGGKAVREQGKKLEAEREVSRSATGVDEDWVFNLLRAVTGIGFEELENASYQIVDLD